MLILTRFLALLLILLPALGHAFYTDPGSDEARLVMEQGILTNEKIYEFFEAHPCELGLQKDCNRPLSNQDLTTLKNLLLNLEKWRKTALELAMPETDVLQGRHFELKLGDSFKVVESLRWNSRTLSKEKFLTITYRQDDVEAQRFVQGVRISTATSLLLFDSFFRLAQTLSKAKKIRAILDYDLPNEGPILTRTYNMAMDKKLWDAANINLKFMQAEQNLRVNRVLDQNEEYFEQYVAKSFVAQELREDASNFRLRTMIFMRGQRNETTFFGNLELIVGRLSKFFGNTIGKVQTRDGKLKKLALDPIVMTGMKMKLKPLDILLEKTPMILTDKFIPGYFGHVAIWLGTPEELANVTVIHEGKSIPLLSHPTVLPHLASLSQGKLIVEALRLPGVTMNTLEHFMDIDDLLVLRSESYDPKTLGEHLLRTFEQVGKAYDFNFNIETQREIVCSELVYAVYTQEAWPTSVSVRRHTISPDHVAWKALDSCFEPILMYQDGKIVEDRHHDVLRGLLSRPGGITYTTSGTCFKTYGLKF